MSVLKSEMFKVFGRKTMLGGFLALAVLNCVLLWVKENRRNELYTAAQYKAAFTYYEEMPMEEAYRDLELRLRELRLIESLYFGSDISEAVLNDPDMELDELLKKAESREYLIWTDNIFREEWLLRGIFAEVDSCRNYDQYLEGIDRNAENMKSSPIFADPDTFRYRNIVKTQTDFEHLKNSILSAAPSKGIVMATDSPITDLIGFCMILFAAVTLITREKELDQLLLSRTTYYGRGKLGVSKLLAACFSALFAVIILYGGNFLLAHFMYGFGDCTRQLQSVYGFGGSNLKVSVAAYFFLFLAAKILVYSVMAELVFAAAVLADTAGRLLGTLALILGVEALFYDRIPSTSYLCLLKQINLVSFSYTHRLFAQYLNLNILGKPVNAVPVFVISAAFMAVAFFGISLAVFSRCGVVRDRRGRVRRFPLFRGRHVGVFRHECYKIFAGQKVLLILIAYLGFALFSYQPMTERFSDIDAVYYKQYMLMLEGKYTEEKQKILEEENIKFISAEMDMQKMLGSGEDASPAVMLAFQDVLAPRNAFEKVLRHAEYLQTTEDGEFLYDSGYQLLTGDESAGNKDLTLGLAAMTLVLLCLAGIYSWEYQTGASMLLNASLKGRIYTFCMKFLIGLLIVAVIFVITYAPYYYNVLSAYGIRGINAPACSMESLSGVNLSIKNYLIVVGIGRFLALVVGMLAVYYLASKLKSLVFTLVLGTILLIVPILLTMLGIEAFRYVLLNPFLIGNVF